jgi:hypothetical protein
MKQKTIKKKEYNKSKSNCIIRTETRQKKEKQKKIQRKYIEKKQ